MAHLPLTLTDLATRWAATHQPDAMLVRQMRHVTHDLSVLSNVQDPRGLTPTHLDAFQADLRTHYPRPTAQMMFGLAWDLLHFGVREALLATNPAGEMRIAPSPAGLPKPCPPFTPKELARIFGHPIFTAHAVPSDVRAGGIAAYWLPLILLCSGARAEEVAALGTRHLRYSADLPRIPYWCLDAGGEAPFLCKTAASGGPRPVHPILCRLGLLDYVARLPPGSDLFPLLRPDREGRRARRFCAYLRHFLRQEVGIVDPCQGAHSFRRTFAHACRQAALPDALTCALLGRPTPVSGDPWHAEAAMPLVALQQAMARLTFPGFPL